MWRATRAERPDGAPYLCATESIGSKSTELNSEFRFAWTVGRGVVRWRISRSFVRRPRLFDRRRGPASLDEYGRRLLWLGMSRDGSRGSPTMPSESDAARLPGVAHEVTKK